MLFANTYGDDGRADVTTMRQIRTLDVHLARFTHLLPGADSELGDAGAEVVAAASAKNPELEDLNLCRVLPRVSAQKRTNNVSPSSCTGAEMPQ